MVKGVLLIVNACERRLLARETHIGISEMSCGYTSGAADE